MRVKLLYTSIANTSITQNAEFHYNTSITKKWKVCNGTVNICNGSIMLELCNGSIMMELCKGSIMMELCNGRVETTWPEMLHNPHACNIRKHDWAGALRPNSPVLKIAGD